MGKLVTTISLDEGAQWYLQEIKRLTGGRTMTRIIGDALFQYYWRQARLKAKRDINARGGKTPGADGEGG